MRRTVGAVAFLFPAQGRDDLDDDVSGLERLAFGFPETQRLSVAINAQASPAARQFADRLAAFVFGHLAFDQMDAARNAGEVGEIFADMFALGAAGQQQAGEAHGVDDDVRPSLPRERFVVVCADHNADRHVGCQRAHGQDDQDRSVVAPGGNQHVRRLVDVHRLQRLVPRGVRRHHVAAQRFGIVQPVFAGVDHDAAAWVGAALDQFVDRLRSGNAEAQHHDMLRQLLLDAGHAPFLPAALDDEIVGGAHEDEEDGEADRRHDDRLDQPRPVRNRRDIAEPGSGDRDHGEIDHVEETALAVEIVDQPFAVPPVDHDHDKDEKQRQAEADAEIAPDRDLHRTAQRLVARAAIGPRLGLRRDGVGLLLAAHYANRSANAPSEAWCVRSSWSGVTAI